MRNLDNVQTRQLRPRATLAAVPPRVLRSDPHILAALAPFGLDEAPAPVSVHADLTLEERLANVVAAERRFEGVFDALFTGLPPVKKVERRTKVILGVDENPIDLYNHLPTNIAAPVRRVYYIRGGGMALQGAAGTAYRRWRDEVCAHGMLAVGVESRDGGGKLGNHSFPAGFNDCVTGLQWKYDRKATLGVSRIFVSGEFRAGNLNLATALKDKQDGKLKQIDGAYAMFPFISNALGGEAQGAALSVRK